MPQISIVIPTYNRAHYIAETVQSVLDQTFTNFEIIVVDDGSTDDTESVVHRIADSRVKYVWQENQKSAGAYNTGIRAATGDYIVTLDSDDLLAPTLLDKQMAKIEADAGIGFIAAGRGFVDGAGRSLGYEWRPWEWGHSLRLEDWLMMGCPMNHSGNLIRRDWLDRLGLMDERAPLNEDYDLYIRLARHGCEMIWLEEVLVFYRLHDTNLIHDAGSMRDGHTWVLQKFFADESLPADIRAMEVDAFTRQHLQSAGWAFACNDIETGKAELEMAVSNSPQSLQERSEQAVLVLTGPIEHPVVKDPQTFMRTIIDNLSEKTAHLAPHIKLRGQQLGLEIQNDSGASLISIIVAAYNVSKNISRRLLSK